MRFTADFETTTNPNDCRVWAYAVASIEQPGFFKCGNSIDGFMRFCKDYSFEPDFVVYFHNLKFDGEFIFNWLFRNGFEYVKSRDELDKKTFTTLIDRNKTFYSIEVCFNRKGKNREKVVFYDSLKILPFSVAKIAKGFNLPLEKLEIDYEKERPVGHELTPHEVKYIENDVKIVALALKTLFDRNLTSMTAGSNALQHFKHTLSAKRFTDIYPILDCDDFVRKSYKGGFTYVQKGIVGKTIKNGIVLDVNSLYPYVMYTQVLPYGEPKYYSGKYKHDEIYPLFVQKIRCQFELKPGKIPSIQLKNNPRFSENEYLENSGDIEEILTLTSVDLDLFFEHYNVFNLEWIEGYKFKGTTGIFSDFIDYWSNEKITAKEQGNSAIYTLAKLMLNSLYGKFATNPEIQSAFPYLDENKVVRYALHDKETRSPVYVPVGSFITSYARAKTIRAAQANYKRFLYADTDSLHLRGLTEPKGLEIDPYKMGAWKHEYTFSKAKFLRQKCYVEYGKEPHENQEYYKVTVAGMPASIHSYINFNNFNFNTKFIEKTSPEQKDDKETIYIEHKDAKIKPLHVPGGIVLVPVDFTIKL